MRLAFALVGVQKRLIGDASTNEVELPDEVGDVADAGAEALAEQRGRLVSGVSGEKDVAAAPLLRDAAPEGVDRLPVRSELVGRAERRG